MPFVLSRDCGLLDRKRFGDPYLHNRIELFVTIAC